MNDGFSFGSLFAGIGGLDLGFGRVGMSCAWQVEIDGKCNEVLAHHWPGVQRYGDVKDVGRQNLKTVDLICGGFPCQGLSVAGRRAGLADERSGLWWEFHRIIEELHPRWVVIENVPGLLSSSGGRDMGAIVGALAELGYGWAYRSLDAQYDGVAQRRKRVFIVGYSGDVGRLGPSASKQNVPRLASLPVKVLFESSSVCWDTAPSRKAGEKPAYTLAASVRGTGNGHGQGWNSNYIVKHALSGHNQRNDPDGEQFVVCNAFDGCSGGLVGVRRLTPTECERLQGFPDGWTAVNGMKDTARYKMLGNAVCVPVAEWIGARIISVI